MMMMIMGLKFYYEEKKEKKRWGDRSNHCFITNTISLPHTLLIQVAGSKWTHLLALKYIRFTHNMHTSIDKHNTKKKSWCQHKAFTFDTSLAEILGINKTLLLTSSEFNSCSQCDGKFCCP